MTDMLERQLVFEEGVRLKKYRCSAGHWTIGIGHNLDADPCFRGAKIPDVITREYAEALFRHDLTQIRAELYRRWPRIAEFDAARRDAFMNMAFQMGVDRFLEFERMRAAAIARDWAVAHQQALKSRWAMQTPNRAKRVAQQILTGKYYEIPEG